MAGRVCSFDGCGKLLRSDNTRGCCKKCFPKTPEGIAYTAEWYKANSGRISATNKRDYAADKERYKNRVREWAQANPDTIRNYQVKNWARKCLYAADASSKRRGHERASVLITAQFILELYEKQNRKCYWTGVEMIPVALRHAPLQPSLERLDNSVGYTPENVVLACYCINRARRDLAVDVFENALREIAAALVIKYGGSNG